MNLVSAFIVAAAIWGATPVPQAAPAPELGELIKSIVIQNVPLVIDEKKGWGDQVRIFDGFHAKGKGLNVKLQVRKKPVNHGLWKHYRISVPDPQQNLTIRFPRIQYVKGKGIEFTVDVLAHARVFVDLKQYNNGVKLFSAATEADMDIRVVMQGTIGVSVEPNSWIADVLLTPRVEKVTLEIPNIDVERFGKVRGKLAHETGDQLRRLIEDKINDKEPSLPGKINRQITKKWDDGTLRVSVVDFLRTNL